MLPAHGSLVVVVMEGLDLPAGRYACARVRSQDEPGETGAFYLPRDGGQRSYPMRPGRWELELCTRTKPSDTASEQGTGRTWSVQVEAGRTTTLRIE